MTVKPFDIEEGKAFVDLEWGPQESYYSGVVVNHLGEVSHFVITNIPESGSLDEEVTKNQNPISRKIEEKKVLLIPAEGKNLLIGNKKLKLNKFLERWISHDPSTPESEAFNDPQYKADIEHQISDIKKAHREGYNLADEILSDYASSMGRDVINAAADAHALEVEREMFASFPAALLTMLAAYAKRPRTGVRLIPEQQIKGGEDQGRDLV